METFESSAIKNFKAKILSDASKKDDELEGLKEFFRREEEKEDEEASDEVYDEQDSFVNEIDCKKIIRLT